MWGWRGRRVGMVREERVGMVREECEDGEGEWGW